MGDETAAISPAQAAVGSGFQSIDWGDNEECPICRKKLGAKAVAVPDCCNHFFCYACIKSWVTKSKSNCPMDRMEVAQLRVFDTTGRFKRREKVEPKEQQVDVEFDLDDEGICPDCGWMGMRATVGVCLHCMYHVDNPRPVENCPQCMENESDPSDEEWTPVAANIQVTSRRTRTLRSDNNQHVIVESTPARASGTTSRRRRNIEDFVVNDETDEESDYSVHTDAMLQSSDDSSGPGEEENQADEDFVIAGPSSSRAPPRPVRKPVTKRKVTRKRKTTKRKTTKRKTTKRKTTKKKTTKRKTKRKVKGRRKTTKRKTRRVSNRPTLPEDSAKRRLARILGVKPPRLSGQMMPRGCKKRPVTASQRRAMMEAAGASNVYNRPLESIDFHNNATPTLHLFGGEQLEYFPSSSDSDDSSSSCNYPRTRRVVPSTCASVIQKYKNNALKSLRRRNLNAVAASVTVPPPTDVLGSILMSQERKFEIKSTIQDRIDPYKSSVAPPAVLVKSKKQLRFCTSKKSPNRDEEFDLYGDIPPVGGAGDDEPGDSNNGDDDFFFESGGAGSSSGAGGEDGDDEKDKKDSDPEDDEEKEEAPEEEEEEEVDGINEMVIDESVLADEEEPPPPPAEDPLEVAQPKIEIEVDPLEEAAPLSAEQVITPDIFPTQVQAPVEEAPRSLFRYSATSLQIAMKLNVDEDEAEKEQDEPEDFPEEPPSEPDEPEEKSEHKPDKSEEKPEVKPFIKEEAVEPKPEPVLSPPAPNSSPAKTRKTPTKIKSRKKSLVEQIFGSDVEEDMPKRKASTDKSGPEGSEDGEIKEKARRQSETEKCSRVEPVQEVVAAPSPERKRSPERRKKKDSKNKESSKKKKKDRRKSRSRSRSSERRKKHHSSKFSPPRRSRKRSRSRSRKRNEENGRVPVHERLGPKRGRSRERSEEQKAVYSSGEKILVSVNFSRRRKRIAEIAAKRRPVAVINLAVDDDKSPVVEKGDSPKEVIELDEAWSSEDEKPKRSRQRESPHKQKEAAHKNAKLKETGPKTPPEPQVKFSITARPQLKLKNVLGVHDDDDDEEEQPAQEQKESAAEKTPAETYDPFNPTASPRTEPSPPKQTIVPEQQPPPRPLSPPKLLTEMPKLERPPPPVAAPVAPPIPSSSKPPVTELFPGLPANVANILCASQLQNVFTPQLSALAMPLLLSAPFMNMQNVVQQPSVATTAPSAHSKVDNGVVDMDLESPYSPAASEGDDLFEPPAAAKSAGKAAGRPQDGFDSLLGKREAKSSGSSRGSSKHAIKTAVITSSGKKEIPIKMERNNLKIVGSLPNAAIENQVKEKFLKKLNRQERVVEEVKVALKPHYTKKLVSKEEYKEILRRAVPKVCHNRSGEINPAKIKGLINEYVKKIRHERNRTKKV